MNIVTVAQVCYEYHYFCHFGGQIVDGLRQKIASCEEMSYSDSLKGPEKERYERKLQCLYGVTGRSSKEKCVEVLDPYHISVELSWPPIEFPHVYTYLIDTPGEFTREKLKAFKSLQAYNYYIR